MKPQQGGDEKPTAQSVKQTLLFHSMNRQLNLRKPRPPSERTVRTDEFLPRGRTRQSTSYRSPTGVSRGTTLSNRGAHAAKCPLVTRCRFLSQYTQLLENVQLTFKQERALFGINSFKQLFKKLNDFEYFSKFQTCFSPQLSITCIKRTSAPFSMAGCLLCFRRGRETISANH